MIYTTLFVYSIMYACIIYYINLLIKLGYNKSNQRYYSRLGGCPFNGPLSGTKYPTRAASPIKYNADQEPVKLKRLEP